MRSAVVECTTDAEHVCRDCPPRKIAPTRGLGTEGTAVTVAATAGGRDGGDAAVVPAVVRCGVPGLPQAAARTTTEAIRRYLAWRMIT
jgi:hypothetical protein